MGKHYVPQEYLRGFATTPDRTHVWLFDKKTRLWAHAAISKVAQEADYYTPEVEARLSSEVERPGHVALDKLRRREPLNSTERDSFAYYLAAMVMRGPRRRRKGGELFPQVLEATVAQTRKELHDLRTPETEKRIQELLSSVERIERDYRSRTPQFIEDELAEPWPSDTVLASFRKMAWRLVDIPNDRFLFTTDNPSFYFEGLGVGSEDAEVTIPLCSDLALLGSYQGDRGATIEVTVRAPLVKEIARRVASGTERFVFSPRKASWIETLVLRRAPNLSKIRW